MIAYSLELYLKGSELLTGQQALSVLSNQGLCTVDFVVIISAATFIFALPRTLHGLNFFAFASCASITLAGLLAMIGAGRNPTPGRVIDVTVKSSFFEAFLAITGPVRWVSPYQMYPAHIRLVLSKVFAYAGMHDIIHVGQISED